MFLGWLSQSKNIFHRPVFALARSKYSTIRQDHAHLLKFLGRNAGRRQIEKMLLAGAVEIDFAQYVSSGTLTDSCPIKRVYVNQLAANNPIEDRWNMGFTQVDGIVSSCLFTILDGHSGTACVHTLAWSVLDYVAAAFLDTRKLEVALEHLRTHDADQPYHLARRLNLLSSTDHRRLGHAAIPPGPTQLLAHMRKCLWDYVNEIVKRGIERSMDPVDCMTEALLRLDRDLCSTNLKAEHMFHAKSLAEMDQLSKSLIRIALSGAVGCVGRLFWSNDSHGLLDSAHPIELHMANVGDCRAVLLREVESATPGGDFPVLEAIPCTHAHQGATSSSEFARVTAAHPENRSTELFREGGRLLGELAPSRAFGNVRYKWPKERLIELAQTIQDTYNEVEDEHLESDQKRTELPFGSNLLMSPLPRPYTSPPYLTAEPEVTRFQLTPQDRYIVLATDGLWDMLSTEDSAAVMEVEFANPSCPATRLLWNCLSAIRPTMARGILSRDRAKTIGDKVNKRASIDLLREETSRKAFDRAYKLLCLPPGLARYHRDDITVMVLELFDRSKFIHRTTEQQ